MAADETHDFLGAYEEATAREEYYSFIASEQKPNDGLIFLDANIILDLNRDMPNGRPALELLMAQAEQMNARFVITNLVAQHELLGKIPNPDKPEEYQKTSDHDNKVIEKFLSYFSKAKLDDAGQITVTEDNHPRLLLLDTPQGADQLRMIYNDKVRLAEEQNEFAHLHYGKNYGEKDIITAIESLKGNPEGVSLAPVFVASRDNYLRDAVESGLANAEGFKVGFAGTDGIINALLHDDNKQVFLKTYQDIYKEDLTGVETPANLLDALSHARSYVLNKTEPQITRTASTLDADNTLKFKAAIGAESQKKQVVHPIGLEAVFSGKLIHQQAVAAEEILQQQDNVAGLQEIATQVKLGEEEKTAIRKYAERQNRAQISNRKDSKYKILHEAIEKATNAEPPITEIVVMDRRATDLFHTYRHEKGTSSYSDLISLLNLVPGILIIPSDIDFDVNKDPELLKEMEGLSKTLGQQSKLTLVSDDVDCFHKHACSEQGLNNVERYTSYSFVQGLVKNANFKDNIEALLAMDDRPRSNLRGMHSDVHQRRGSSRPLGVREDKFTLQPPLRWLFKESTYPIQAHNISPDGKHAATNRIKEIVEKSKIYSLGQNLKDAGETVGRASNLIKRPDIASFIDWSVALQEGRPIPWDAMDYLRRRGTISHLEKKGKISKHIIQQYPETPVPLATVEETQPIQPAVIKQEPLMPDSQPEQKKIVDMTPQYGVVADEILKLTEQTARTKFGHKVDDLREDRDMSYETLAQALNERATIKLQVTEDDIFNWGYGDSLPDVNEFLVLQQILIDENEKVLNKTGEAAELKSLYEAALAQMGLTLESSKKEINKAFAAPENKSAAEDFGKKMARLSRNQYRDDELAAKLNLTTRRIKDESLPDQFDKDYIKKLLRGEQEVSPALSALLTKALGEGVHTAYEEYRQTVSSKEQELAQGKANFIKEIVAAGANTDIQEATSKMLEIVQVRNRILEKVTSLHEVQKGFKTDFVATGSSITRETVNGALGTLLKDSVNSKTPDYSEGDQQTIINLLEKSVPPHTSKTGLSEDVTRLYWLISQEKERQKGGVAIAV